MTPEDFQGLLDSGISEREAMVVLRGHIEALISETASAITDSEEFAGEHRHSPEVREAIGQLERTLVALDAALWAED